MATVTDRPLGLGFVGVGMIAQVAHLPHYAADPRCRLVALAERRERMGRAVADHWHFDHCFVEQADLLAQDAVDAVIVVAPRAAVGPMVLEALQSGRHVLSEKPMAHTLAQAETLVAEAARQGVAYGVGFMKRHDPGVLAARQCLERLRDGGELGRLLGVRIYNHTRTYGVAVPPFIGFGEKRQTRFAEWPTAPDWLPLALHASYAWFVNVAIHDINLGRFLVGDMDVGAAECGDGWVRTMLRAGEVPVLLEILRCEADVWHEGAEMVFEQGRMHLELPSPMMVGRSASVRIERSTPARGVEMVACPDAWAFARQATAFVDSLCDGAAFAASGHDSLGDMRITEEIWRRIARS